MPVTTTCLCQPGFSYTGLTRSHVIIWGLTGTCEISQGAIDCISREGLFVGDVLIQPINVGFGACTGKMCLIFRRDILPEGLDEASEIVDEELGPVENGPIPTLSHVVYPHEIRRDSFVFGDLMT